MLEKIFRWLASHSERRPVLLILVILAVTALAMVGFTFIKSEFGYKAMLPKKLESVKTMEEAEDVFGGTIEEQLLLEGDILDPAVLRKVAGYEAFLQSKPDVWETFVTDVITPLDEMSYFSGAGSDNATATETPLTQKMGGLDDEELVLQVERNIEAAAERARLVGMASGGIQGISQDRHALLITARINPERDTNEQIKLVDPFEDYTREYFQDLRDVTLYESGIASQNRDANQKVMEESRLLFGLAMAFILIVLFLTFRRVSDVLLTMMVIIVTIIWVIGLSGWLRFPYTYTSTAIMPLLLGIDIAYAIHVMSRYYEERRSGGNPFASSTAAVVTTGVAVFLTAATTAFGFASFAISDMPPVVQFGMLCMAGVLFSFLLSVTLLPAAIVLRDRSGKAQEKWARKNAKRIERAGETRLDRALARIAVLSEHHRLTVGIVTLLTLVACGVLASNVSTNADLARMMKGDTPSMQASEVIQEYFGGQNIAYALAKGDILEPANLESLLRYEEEISSSEYASEQGGQLIERGRVTSIADIVRNVNQGTIPSSKQEVVSLLLKLWGNGGNSNTRLLSEDGQVAMISVRFAATTQEDIERIADIMRGAGKNVTADNPALAMSYSGIPVLMRDLLKSLVPTQLKTSTLALFLCALIVSLVFGSLVLGLAATSVVFLGIALEIGALVVLGWSLDFMTVMISSLVIGAGIDFGIHVTHRFREEWRGGVGVDEAIRRTVAHVGKVLLAAAATTAGAFAIIAASDLEPLRRFGGITALSLTFALLASLLVLPSILAWYANRVERRKAVRAKS